jgi:hypothetical protein
MYSVDIQQTFVTNIWPPSSRSNSLTPKDGDNLFLRICAWFSADYKAESSSTRVSFHSTSTATSVLTPETLFLLAELVTNGNGNNEVLKLLYHAHSDLCTETTTNSMVLSTTREATSC